MTSLSQAAQNLLPTVAIKAAAVDISSAPATLDPPARSLYVGTGGNLVCTLMEGSQVTFSNVPDGAILPIATTAISNTSTASGIIALY